MSPTTRLALGITLTSILAAQTQRLPRATSTDTEEPERPNPTNQTMKPLARGTHYAVASMMQQATVTAEHVLSAGGNAFDAIVGDAGEGFKRPRDITTRGRWRS